MLTPSKRKPFQITFLKKNYLLIKRKLIFPIELLPHLMALVIKTDVVKRDHVQQKFLLNFKNLLTEVRTFAALFANCCVSPDHLTSTTVLREKLNKKVSYSHREWGN